MLLLGANLIRDGLQMHFKLNPTIEAYRPWYGYSCEH